MKSTLFTIALFVAAAVAQSSTPFYFTSPVSGTSYKAGDVVTIDWINGLDQAANVQLLTGTNSATMTPTGDSFTIEGDSGEYDWTVPSDLPQNATFSFMVQYVDSTGSSQEAFSAPFTITGTTGDVVTQPFSTASATSSAASSRVSSASSTIANATSSTVPSTLFTVATTASSSSVSASSASASASATQNSGASSVKKASLMAAGAMAIVGAALLF